MAAFSSHYQYLADSIYLPNDFATKTDGVLDEFMPNLSHIYASSGHYQNPATDHDHMEGSSFDASAHESSCIEQQSIQNDPSVTENQGSHDQNLLMPVKAENAEQVTQTRVPADRKRRSKNGSSLNSTNSKDAKQVKCKKQKGVRISTKDMEKDQKKADEEPPKGYIHVRARRGQATDSHSLAERVRREKISQRMKMLQALVPGCNKITGKALMLDEIINYVQSLQTQVEFLSMKLTSLDPMLYTFGLMDLDPMTFGTQVTSNEMAQTMPLVQPSTSGYGSTSPSQAFANANTLTSPATSSTAASASTFPTPIFDVSTNLQHHEQKQSFHPQQGAGSLYWGLNEQERQNIINQFGFSATNLMYSLQ